MNFAFGKTARNGYVLDEKSIRKPRFLMPHALLTCSVNCRAVVPWIAARFSWQTGTYVL